MIDPDAPFTALSWCLKTIGIGEKPPDPSKRIRLRVASPERVRRTDSTVLLEEREGPHVDTPQVSPTFMYIPIPFLFFL